MDAPVVQVTEAREWFEVEPCLDNRKKKMSLRRKTRGREIISRLYKAIKNGRYA